MRIDMPSNCVRMPSLSLMTAHAHMRHTLRPLTSSLSWSAALRCAISSSSSSCTDRATM